MMKFCLCVARDAQSTQNNKFAISLQYLKENVKDEVDFFFYVWVFLHEHSQITGLQGKGEGILLTLHYYFHLLHRHLDISQVITAESTPLHIASSRT